MESSWFSDDSQISLTHVEAITTMSATVCIGYFVLVALRFGSLKGLG